MGCFRKLPQKKRAGEGTRTPDILITSEVLYQLSYSSINSAAILA